MNIKLVKLTSGEEIVADMGVEPHEGHGENIFLLKNPVTFIAAPEGIGMIPWMMMADNNEEIRIKEKHIIWYGKVQQDIYNAYNSKYGSGLVVPEQNDKIIV